MHLCSASFQEQAEMLEAERKFKAEQLNKQMFTVSGTSQTARLCIKTTP
jgi:hypothetical protein